MQAVGELRMLRLIVAALALAAAPGAAAATNDAVQVMVLGSWHFSNPGQDIVNVEAEDVRTAPRQRELETISEALAEFRPTKIMVEKVATSPDLIDESYAGFTPKLLRERKDERAQIGYRLAHKLGHEKVYAIDEQSSEGEPDYFPFGRVMGHAQAHNQMARLQAGMAEVEAQKKAFQEKQGRTDLATLLLEENEPSPWKAGIGGYYEMLSVGDTEEQPGAELNAYWYMRNAKIFGKLMTVAQPGDRILVIVGTSHAYWLRHFADEVIGYQNVDPRPYLRRAAQSLR